MLSPSRGKTLPRLAPGRVELRHGDLFDAVTGETPFDLVVSNPPYVARSEIPAIDRSIRDWEPFSAWLSGEDSVIVHERILRGAAGRLAPHGAVMLEIGSGDAEVVERARRFLPGARVVIEPDLAGTPRIVIVERRAGRGSSD